MRKLALCVAVCFVPVVALLAQTPNLSGVWKLNAEKSKVSGPAPGETLMIIEQADGKLKETVGVKTQHGEQRRTMTFNLGEKPSNNMYMGASMRSTAAWQGGTLVVNSKLALAKPGTATDKFTLSPDGKTLTLEQESSANGRDMHATYVFEKQPDSAGEALRKPEETAGAHFKNVQLLKEVPESQFIDVMRSFNIALGAQCNFCHAEGDFSSDEKKTKVFARKMITMTHDINANTFNGRNEVRCYTCHQGHHEPMSHPAFE